MLRRFLTCPRLRRDMEFVLGALVQRSQQTLDHLDSVRSTFEQISIESTLLIQNLQERKVLKK